MTDDKKLIEQIGALIALNEGGKVSHKIPGLVVNLLTKAAARLEALTAAQGEAVAWSYEFHEFGDVWKRHVILNRPDGGANPPTKHYGSEVRNVRPLYTHPTPDRGEMVEAAKALLGQWQAFEASYGNQEEAYYKLAKYARPHWAALAAALTKHGGDRG